MKKQPSYLLNQKVIVKQLESQEETPNGIIIPKTANADLEEGLVVMFDPALGKCLKKGDIVVYPRGSGQGQLINGTPHIWIGINEIWGGFSIDEE